MPRATAFMILSLCAPWSGHANEIEQASKDYRVEVLSIGTPSASLSKGHNEFPVTIEIQKYGSSEVEYLAFLSINDAPTAPFSIILVGGPSTVRETFVWNINLSGSEVSVRFRLLGFSSESNTSHRIVDFTRTYTIRDSVKSPLIHVVAKEESLSDISRKYYGVREKWRVIYEANRSAIGANPNLIHAGMKLTIPVL